MADMLAMGVQMVNLLLLLALLFIYGTNYRKLKSKYTGGLVFFAGFLLLETVAALFADATMTMYYSTAAQQTANIIQAVKAAGLAVLLWISIE